MIRLDHISIGYRDRILLQDLSLDLPSGTLNALTGRNGTGKSTLLRTIAGLHAPLNGNVTIDGRDVRALSPLERARAVSLVSTARVRVPALSCREVVALGRAPYTSWSGKMSDDDRLIVDRALEQVNMCDFASRPVTELSDGECQRIFIARALAQQTPVMLLDEPTAFLDVPSRHEIGALLRSLANQGKCILFSTHDMDIVRAFADDEISI